MSLIEQWKEKEKTWSGKKFAAQNRKYLFIYVPLMIVGIEALIVLLAVLNRMPAEDMKRNLLYGLAFGGGMAGIIILFILSSMLFGGARRHMKHVNREIEKQLPTQQYKEEFARQMMRPEEILLHRELKDGGIWLQVDVTRDYICCRTHTIACGIVRLRDTAEVKSDVEKRYYNMVSETNRRSQPVSVYPIEFYYTGNTTIDDKKPKPDAKIFVSGRQLQLDILDILEKREEN